MNESFDTVVVPIAGEEDAETTCRAIRQFVSGRSEIVVVHVIEKAGGGIDPASVEQREREAQRSFGRCVRELSTHAGTVRATPAFDTDVVAGILGVTRTVDADAIVFTPRGANRLLKLASGDVTLKLIDRADRPVVVVPPAKHHAHDRR